MTSAGSSAPGWVNSAYADPWAKAGMAIRLLALPSATVLAGAVWGNPILQLPSAVALGVMSGWLATYSP